MGSNFEYFFTGLSLRGEQTVSEVREMGSQVGLGAHRTLPRTRRMVFEARYLVGALPPPPTQWWGWRGEAG